MKMIEEMLDDLTVFRHFPDCKLPWMKYQILSREVRPARFAILREGRDGKVQYCGEREDTSHPQVVLRLMRHSEKPIMPQKRKDK